MALLYSRPRIKIPKILIFNKYRSNKKKNNYYKIRRIILVLIIIMILGISIVKAVIPVFDRLCIEKAKSIATIICNKQTSKNLKDYKYSDFVLVHMDENKNIKMLESNMININNVISNIAEDIQIEINNIQSDDIYISSGSFTGISLLAGRGPKIPIKISIIGNVKTDFKSEFIDKGINQTLHRLYLEIECNISVLTPFKTINEKIINQFIVAENLIVGNIPDSYYNLEGITQSDAMQLME